MTEESLADYVTRLEQENKALKDNNNHLQAIIDDGRAENKRFREENKELKEENVKLLFGKGALIKLCDNLTKIIDEKKEKESKLWQALEEIRTYLDTLSSIDSDFPNTETYLRIQDKINGVLNLS